MDRPRLNDQLGVKRIGKNIKKSPLHQPNLANGIAPSWPRLQKISPAPVLTQINQSLVPLPTLARPPMHPLPQPMMGHRMHYLQSSLGDSGPNGNQMQPQAQVLAPPQPPPPPPHSRNHHHSPRFNGSLRDNPILPTPRFNGRGILPSPASQYLLPSPTAYRNLVSPRSPYPSLSPGVGYSPPLTPRSFTVSSMDQPGILGPGTSPQPPPSSPGVLSPSSAYGLFHTL
uniref:Protein HAIKU1 n=1 Tax=Noccaea caerulescens TaxID=107243 RepID=A0A1J3DHY3_NOCCA